MSTTDATMLNMHPDDLNLIATKGPQCGVAAFIGIGRARAVGGARRARPRFLIATWSVAYLLVVFAASCARVPSSAPSSAPPRTPTSNGAATSLPALPPSHWLGLLGEYGSGAAFRIVSEHEGRLRLVDTALRVTALTARGETEFVVEPSGERVRFTRDAQGRATRLVIGATSLDRNRVEPDAGSNQLRITPVRPVEQLRVEALAASPPVQPGPFVASDLTELVRLDPTIRLEIRYATTNNFLGTRFYDEARAFLQRPAAEAVVRVHRALRPLGYGLLVHDGYRPWYVTKMFWDATPLNTRWLVADPAEGSRHNRGAAVDLTMFDLATGLPVEMPSTYDESTGRAYADYPGGTSRQRWLRGVLRSAMEAQGFRANLQEWWHFDYSTWRSYQIENVPFARIELRK